MFSTYLKSLNDVFATSEGPEEQPTTGVLGRIGSWFSPWKAAKGPQIPSENASPTRDQAAEDQEGEGPVRPRRWQGQEEEEEEEEEEGEKDPNPLGLFFCEDATQSARRHDSAESEQARSQRPTQAQAGRRLHVYLEETSVIQRGQDACTSQEVVRTKVTKSIQILPKAKPGSSEGRGTDAGSGAGAQSFSSSARLNFDLESDSEQSEDMGRKRRPRKNSQGESVSSPLEKTPPTGVPEVPLASEKPATDPQGKSPNSHMGPENSAPEQSLTPQACPQGGENKSTSCSESAKSLDDFQDSLAACELDGQAANMERDDETFYKVERKTETPESKRRSMKVSRSEVKLFRKNVPLKPAVDVQDGKPASMNDKEKEPDARSRPINLKKIEEEPKTASRRIADRISLFEQTPGVAGLKKNLQTPRSADVSPVRKVTERQRADRERSRSADRLDEPEPGHVSAHGEKPLSIKERMRNLNAASTSPVLSHKPTGMSQKSTSSVMPERDRQGKLDAKDLRQTTAKAEITVEPDGQVKAANISNSKEKQTDNKSLKAADQGAKSTEGDTSVKGTADSSEKEANDGPQSKDVSRTGSRPKRRKSRDPTSPLSPNSDSRATDEGPVRPMSPSSETKMANKEPISVDSENKTPSKESSGSISVKSGERAKPDESATPISPKSDTKSSSDEPTGSISLKNEKKAEPKNSIGLSRKNTTTSLITQSSENKTSKEPAGSVSLKGGSKTTSEDPVSPKSDKKSSRDEPTSSIGLKSGNKATSEECPTSVSQSSEIKTKSKELVGSISLKSGIGAKPKDSTGPISPKSDKKSVTEESTSAISISRDDKTSVKKEPTSVKKEPTSLIGQTSDKKTPHKEAAGSIAPKSGRKSTSEDSTSDVSPKSVKKVPTSVSISSDRKTPPKESAGPVRLKSGSNVSLEEPAISISLDSEDKTKQKTEQVVKAAVSSSKQITTKVSSEKLSESKEKTNKKEGDKPHKQKESDSSLIKKHVEGSPETSVNKDEPDTAAGDTGTRRPIDKDAAIIPRKEETAGGRDLVFTQEREQASGVGAELSATSTAKTPPQADKDPSVLPVPGSKGKVREPGQKEKGPKPESKDVEKPEKTNKTERKDEVVNKKSPEALVTEKGDESKIAGGKDELIKDRIKPQASKPASKSAETPAGSSTSSQSAHVGQTATSTKGGIFAGTNEATSCADKGPLKGDAALTESSETQIGPVVAAGEPPSNSVSVEKKTLPDYSQTQGANDAESIPSNTGVTTAGEKKESLKASNSPPLRENARTEGDLAEPVSGEAAPRDKGKKAMKALPSEIEKLSEDQGNSLKVHDTTEKQHPLLPNGDISLHSQLLALKKEKDNKPAPAVKVPKSSEPLKLGSMRKLHLPRGLSKDDSSKQQDAPSSWLDVDFPKQKLKFSEPKLSSTGSESNLLDADQDDDDFIERIKKLCAPFQLPPRKHNHLRTPQPPFAMPAIKEARFEKTFDPEEFKFGLRKKSMFDSERPSMKFQKTELKSNLRPARASLADRCMLLSSLDNDSRLRSREEEEEEEGVDGKEEKEIKVRSRLEGSSVLSSLTSSSSSFRRRNEAQADPLSTSSGEVSPSSPLNRSPPPLTPVPPPSPTGLTPLHKGFGEEAQAGEAAVGDSGPRLPSFNDIKLPDYFEKLLQREQAQSKHGQEEADRKDIDRMTTVVPGGADVTAVKLSPPPPAVVAAAPPCFPAVTPPTKQPEKPRPLPQGKPAHQVRAAKGVHRRPGKMVLFQQPEFSGQAFEVVRDVADASSMQLSPVISVKVVRGCWLLYEKPDFQGRTIALEEGGSELTNIWAEPADGETEPQNLPPMQVGSIRLAVWDYSIPRIDLFTEPDGHGRVTPYQDEVVETGSFGIPLSTASIQVHCGVWLVFSDPGFQGMLAVLEAGVYPVPEAWGFPSPFVGSLRPLRMGPLKVENPNEVKAVVYQEPGFEGSSSELDGDVFIFGDDDSTDPETLKAVGSLKIQGGLWVGYSEPGFEGQQHILEEGEYLDCSEWGGAGPLLSIRPIISDFMSPHLKLFSERDFGALGVNIDLTLPVINMDDTGYGVKTQSIDVIGGVWVVFEEPGFCGQSYILEKGLYGSPEDWGALQPRAASIMPVIMDDFENAAKFKVQLFSEPCFQGSVVALEDSAASLDNGFSVASCKVLAGSWVAFEAQDFSGQMQYVLEVGSFPDLRAMGCANGSAAIRSLQTVGFEFSLPSITLFERGALRGKRVVLTDGCVNLQLAGGCSRVQSLLVEGGMWILYEGVNYLGAQFLVKPGEIPDWRSLSSWHKIGSLRPLLQKQAHFRLRNRHSGLMMSVTGDLDEVKLLRVQETEETDGFEQIWFHQNGFLHCKLLEECCMCPSGSMTMAGSRVGLTPELTDRVHLWSITPDGFVRYTPTPNLVLDIKGGLHYDKNQVILNTLDPSKPQQRWDVEII